MFNFFSKKKVAHNKNELVEFIEEAISKNGECCDLNSIDVSLLKDMGGLFKGSPFNGDISKWDVSNVLLMDSMFEGSAFNGDISKWNVSNVKVVSCMFAHSKFNGDISQWNVSSVNDMSAMFEGSIFNGDISNWNVAKVETMRDMFKESKFVGDLSQWNVSKVQNMESMFAGSVFNGDISNWNVSSCKLFGDMFANSVFSGDISKWNMPESERSRLTGKKGPENSEPKISKPFSARKNWMDDAKVNAPSETTNLSIDSEIQQLERQLREDGIRMNAAQIREIGNKIASLRSKKYHEVTETDDEKTPTESLDNGKEEASNSSSLENNDCSQVKSPLSGRISRITVKVGDTVSRNQEVAIVEALMMDNSVLSPCGGIVKEILVKESDPVSDDQVIMVIG